MKKNYMRTVCVVLALTLAFTLGSCKQEDIKAEETATVEAENTMAASEAKTVAETAATIAESTETVDEAAQGEEMETKPSEAEQKATATSEETTAPTQPPATVAPATVPTTTEEPTPTGTEAPAHVHSYKETVVAPTCTEKGYTKYTCSCGDSYKSNTVTATGHSWGEWKTTKEATTNAEGEQKRTCSGCGATETQKIPKVEKETIDISALISYGINYGVNTYGYREDRGCYAGYYPGYTVNITTMEEGKAAVRAKVDSSTAQLMGAYGSIWEEMEDGTIARTRINIGITHNGGDSYTIFMYYG